MFSPWSVCLFCCRTMVERTSEYIDRSQTHECGNWDWGPAIPFLGIHKSIFLCSAWTFLSILRNLQKQTRRWPRETLQSDSLKNVNKSSWSTISLTYLPPWELPKGGHRHRNGGVQVTAGNTAAHHHSQQHANTPSANKCRPYIFILFYKFEDLVWTVFLTRKTYTIQ